MSKLSENMIVAITGKIASGKSVATSKIKELGYLVFDCDQEIKKIYQENFIEISDLIGDKYIINNTFDYSLIKEEAFNNIYFDRNLKKLLFKILKRNFLKFLADNNNERLIFIDAPTLFEAKFNYLVDKVIFIDSSRELMLKRIASRPNMQVTDLDQFEKLGYPIPYKKYLSDYIIINNGTIAEFQEKISDLINKL